MMVPGRRELMLEIGRLDRDSRRRIYRPPRRGEAARSPREALLVTAVARRNIRQGHWVVAVSTALALLAGLSAVIYFRGEIWLVAWTDLLVFVLALSNVVLTVIWRLPRWGRAHRLNLAVAEDEKAERRQD
jgi:hypothetical protein